MATNNRGYLRVPRSRRKSEREHLDQQALEKSALKAQEEFQRAAQRICGVTVKLMLEELAGVVEGNGDIKTYIDNKTHEAEKMIAGEI